ncbi:MAG: IS1634 family transposase [Christensenellaceae bacterium]|jgi:hypothetical protein|nr:IS1634 family transposase [Christensenellaceae bacterium]
MHINCTTSSTGQSHLLVSESYTIEINGVHKNRKRTIRNIGPLSKFDDGKPNYVERLKKSFKDGCPIIPELTDLAIRAKAKDKFLVKFDRANQDSCMLDPKNLGYFILDGLYYGLGLDAICALHKSRSKIEYDLNGLAKLLIFGRALCPESKKRTYQQKNNYLFNVVNSDNLIEIYRALDVLDLKSEAIQKKMNTNIKKCIGRNTEVCFYNVTNYRFEIGQDDDDVTDEIGNINNGMRKEGGSNEKRREHIVQMGLLIDDNKIPIAYRLSPGNEPDQTTFNTGIEKSIIEMDFSKVIIVSDSVLNDADIAHIIKNGNGYIVSKSAKKSESYVKTWMLAEDGYVWNEKKTFKVKSKIRTRVVKDENGRDVNITEKIVCFWSKRHYDKEIHENRDLIEYLDKVAKNLSLANKRPNKICEFLKETLVNKKTGEVLKGASKVLAIDNVKVASCFELQGYYTLLTSEIDMPDNEIIAKYHRLSRIEDSFKIIESDLDGRPVHVRTPEHINAHFLISFVAITMMRLIQHRVLKFLGEQTQTACRNAGVSASRIKKALNEFIVDVLPGGYCRIKEPNEDMQLILNSLGIVGNFCLPTLHDLHQLKFSIDRVTKTCL